MRRPGEGLSYLPLARVWQLNAFQLLSDHLSSCAETATVVSGGCVGNRTVWSSHFI